ncbi:hypothetical protein NFI96_029517 [Prochilodus magdalenae]|nr:hypothetical protein NFI96_029517 [Prochilodus magdalenae]
MVRPHSGSPRSKPRPFSDSYHTDHHANRFGSSFRSQRGFRGPSGKAPPSWRQNTGGPHPYNKRPPLMGESRERPHGHWTSQNQDSFRSYPQDSQRGRRRPSSPRSNRPPPVQHRMSPHGPSHGSPGHHRPPSFHGNQSGHISPSSRHFHGPPSDRRGPSPHGNYRPPQRHRSPAHEQERNWGPERHPSPRERPYSRPARGGHRWNGPGGFRHPNGEARFSGSPQRKPREFHERSSYPERWSAEREPRKQHGEFGRERGRERPVHYVPEWAQRDGGAPHPRPPFRSPSWKTGPPSDSSSRFPLSPRLQERPVMRPLKRLARPPSTTGLEHGPPKRFRRELSVRPLPPRGFGGRGLSLKDKSRLLKGRKFRAESVARLKMVPVRPRLSDREQKTSKDEDSPSYCGSGRVMFRRSSFLFQWHYFHQRASPPTPVHMRENKGYLLLIRDISSPLDRQLTRDLVVVSHWEAGTRPSSSPKDRPSKNTSSSRENLTLSERFGKLHGPGCPPRDQKERRLPDGPGKPGPFQKPSLRPNLGFKKGPCPDGIFRRPLMYLFLNRAIYKKGNHCSTPTTPSEARVQEEPEHHVQIQKHADAPTQSTTPPSPSYQLPPLVKLLKTFTIMYIVYSSFNKRTGTFVYSVAPSRIPEFGLNLSVN